LIEKTTKKNLTWQFIKVLFRFTFMIAGIAAAVAFVMVLFFWLIKEGVEFVS